MNQTVANSAEQVPLALGFDPVRSVGISFRVGDGRGKSNLPLKHVRTTAEIVEFHEEGPALRCVIWSIHL
ncbi:MAG: hypothetical protein ACRCYU_05555, partial [Nocardioides sp.]